MAACQRLPSALFHTYHSVLRLRLTGLHFRVHCLLYRILAFMVVEGRVIETARASQRHDHDLHWLVRC